jgi:hypothetical protein
MDDTPDVDDSDDEYIPSDNETNLGSDDETNLGSDDDYAIFFDDIVDAEVANLERNHGFDEGHDTKPENSTEPTLASPLSSERVGLPGPPSRSENINGNHATATPHQIPNPYKYNGVACRCAARDHICDASLPASSPLQVDNTCKLLQVLGLKFHRYYRFLICSCKGGSFLALSELKSHFKEKHKTNLRGDNTRTMNRDFPGVEAHISRSFLIAMGQTHKEFHYDSSEGLIAGISPPLQSYACPGDSCQSYLTSMQSASSHYYFHHGNGRTFVPADIEVCWTQHPFAAKGSHSGRVRVNIPDMSTHARARQKHQSIDSASIYRYVPPQGAAGRLPIWAIQAGWKAWREKLLNDGISVLGLRALIIPPKHRRKHLVQSSPVQDDHLYKFGQWFRSRASVMVDQTNTWLGNSELRSALTTG